MGYSDEWKSTPSSRGERAEREMDSIPDGVYECDVEDVSIFRGKSGDAWYISWWFRVRTGLHKGARLQRFLPLDGNVGSVKADMETVLGRIPTWEELANEEAGLAGPVRDEVKNLHAIVRVRQQTKKKQSKVFVNVYINELLSSSPSSGDFQEEEVDEDDAEQQEPAQVSEAPAVAMVPVDAGWGDPGCETCHGKGCAACDIPF